jgi:Na+/melibiose symporter-like transporter
MPVLALKLILVPTAQQPVGQLNAAGYPVYGAVAALIMMVVVLLSCVGTHNRIPMLLSNQAPERATLKNLWAGLKTILLDRSFSSVLLCTFFFSIGAGLAVTLGTYIRTYFWHLSAAHIASITGSAVLGLFLALLVVHLSRKFGKKETVVTMYGIAILAITVPTMLGLLGMMPSNNAELIPLMMIQEIMLVTSVLAALILGGSMFADIADHFQLKTGARIEGLMFSAFVMISKTVSGMGIFFSSFILSMINFPEKAAADAVDPAIVQQLGWIYVIGVGGMCFIAIVALSFYPISRSVHEKILRDLETRAANAQSAV